ncbi:MAG: RT0821/Lpp0805 family surface protein [Cocleimonas sp.]
MKTTITKTMKKTYLITTVLATTMAIAGCSSYGGPNEQTGTILGGVLGGVAGKQVGKGHGKTAAIIVGTIIGSQIGGSIGRSMDDTDRLKMARSLETSSTGQATTWRNPDTNSNYTVTPTRTYEVNTAPCREYTVDAIINGRTEKIYGTACRQADGSWKVQS